MNNKNIGFIFECGPEGPDIKVFRYLINLIDATIKFIPRSLGDKKKLIANCSLVSKNLLAEGCEKVFIVWDLYPPWRDSKPCRFEDRKNINDSLKKVLKNNQLNKIVLLCISGELESWLIADEKVIECYIKSRIKPHAPKEITKFRHPDREKDPKNILCKMFSKNHLTLYNDVIDAEKIVKYITNVSKLKGSESFKRFHFKLTGRTV